MDNVGIALRDKRIAELMEMVSEQQRLILALREANEKLEDSNAGLRWEVEELRREVRASELGKPKGMPGNKRGVGKAAESGAEGEPKVARKKREQNFARPRSSEPTTRVEHAVVECPKCQTTLTHGTVYRTREVIEVVPNPAIVTEHAYIERDCPRCGTTCKPGPELDGIVAGKRRFGVGLMSLIATLREKLRLPIGQIRWYLMVCHRLHISAGAIVDVLRMVAEKGAGQVGEVHEAVRSSPVVNADETGWREDGVNGYVWVYATPTQKYFVRGDRSSGMVRAVLGEEFCGVLVSDFYAAYDCYGGYHQRCWPHLLRDIDDLLKVYPEDRELEGWADSVRRLYRKAKLYSGLETSKRKHEARRHFEQELLALCELGVRKKGSPQHTLCKRIDKYIGELFVFVGTAGVPSDNNAAERDLRHLVTTRKISGGTRSSQGTQTKMALSTLFSTWAARGIDPLTACRHLLTSP